jgi:hypothetical protein
MFKSISYKEFLRILLVSIFWALIISYIFEFAFKDTMITVSISLTALSFFDFQGIADREKKKRLEKAADIESKLRDLEK